MSTTKKGDALELLTLLIERSLSDQPGTVFKKKHKLPDQHGVDREIDLFVTTTVNDKKMEYAFECKNHQKGIGINEITDFNAKIENKGVKGYFVTTGAYQSGAIAKAKALGIHLLSISERTPSGEDIAAIYIYRKRYGISNVSYMVYSEGFEGEALDAVLSGCKECQKKLANLFSMLVIPQLGDMIQKLVDDGLPDEKNPMLPGNSGQPASKEYDIVAELTPGTSFKHQMKNLIEVNRIIVKVKVWYEKVATQKVVPEHFIYDTYDGTGNGTLFSKSEFYIEDQKMILCVSRPGRSTDSQTILLSEEQNVAESIPMAGVLLGNFPTKD